MKRAIFSFTISSLDNFS